MLEAAQRRLDRMPDAMKVRRRTVEHVFGTFKHWMGYTHFLTRRLGNVSTEMSLNAHSLGPQETSSVPGNSKPPRDGRSIASSVLCEAVT